MLVIFRLTISSNSCGVVEILRRFSLHFVPCIGSLSLKTLSAVHIPQFTTFLTD